MMSALDVKQFYPTKTGGLEWYSDKWANGKKRIIKELKYDPYDKQLRFTSGAPKIDLIINGNGTASVGKSTSARIYVMGPWLNTEITCYAKVIGKTRNIQLRSRSNHDLRTTCGFGNYSVKWGDGKKVAIEIEPMHPIYTRHLAEKPNNDFVKNKWTGYKQITRTTKDNKVLVQALINASENDNQTGWKLQTQFVFDGKNVKVTAGKYEPERIQCINKSDCVANDLSKSCLWLKPGKMCWIRADDCDKVDFKSFSIREIDPL